MKKLIKKIVFYDRRYATLKNSFLYMLWKKANAMIASTLYGNPAKDFFIIGVTGTNGKTTTVNILHTLLQDTVAKTVVISTAGIKIGDEEIINDKKMSSLDVFEMQSILASAKAAGCQVAILEVTSIGLEQHRFLGISFDAAVLTNITRDHLDYHGTMENYARAKKKLFKQVLRNGKPNKYAIFPKDDHYGRQWFDDMSFDKKITYGIHSSSMMRAQDVQETRGGTSFAVSYLGNTYPVQSKLVGAFNVYNILAALSVVVQMGVDITKAIDAVQGFDHVDGRMDEVKHHDVTYFIDYAHSPDALEKTLTYLSHIKGEGKLIVVFGAPGNRDKEKRPIMGSVVERFASVMIATDDDPDTENRFMILKQLLQDVKREEGVGLHVIPERLLAIQFAVDIAQPGDIVMLAGKGNEPIQRTNFGTRPRGDKKKLLEILHKEK